VNRFIFIKEINTMKSERERLERLIEKIDGRMNDWFDSEEIDPSPVEVYIDIREKILKRLGELDKVESNRTFWKRYKDPLDRFRNRLKGDHK
jgi:hypothetical protein